MPNSAFTPAVLTVSGSSSTSSGEKNYVTATDGNASGLWTSSTSPTVTISTSTSTIPDNITKASSLAIAWVSGTTGYARYRFTLDQADYGKKFKIQWDQVYGTAGHWTLQVWSNTASDYTGTSTQLTVQTSAVPGITGTFTTSVDMPGSTAPYIEIRIVASSTSATTIYLNSILMGPGTITQGAAISEWQTYTPTLLNGPTTSTNVGKWRRVGTNMEIQGYIVSSGTGAAATFAVYLPSGYTIDSNALAASISAGVNTRGTVSFYDGTNILSYATYFYQSGSIYAIRFVIPGTLNDLLGSNFTTGRQLGFIVTVPIAEFSGSGTVSLGAGAQVEYASNSENLTTAGGTASVANTVYGPSGSAFLAYNSATTTGNSSTSFPVTFQYPIQSDDLIMVEIYFNQGNVWLDAAGVTPYMDQSASRYGIRWVVTGTNQVTVQFGNAGISSTSTFSAAGSAWSNFSGASYRWRVRKAKASSPVGFGKADSTSFGLVGPRRGQYALTVTGTGWTTTRAVGIYYQDQDGNHRLKFNISGACNNTSVSSYSVTITGVTTKNVANYNQAVAVWAWSGSVTIPAGAWVTPNTNPATLNAAHATSNSTQYHWSGDIEIDSKPSWA